MGAWINSSERSLIIPLKRKERHVKHRESEAKGFLKWCQLDAMVGVALTNTSTQFAPGTTSSPTDASLWYGRAERASYILGKSLATVKTILVLPVDKQNLGLYRLGHV